MVYSGFETALDRELPGEIESLIFCIQTGIGVGIIAFIMGRFVERKNGRIVWAIMLLKF